MDLDCCVSRRYLHVSPVTKSLSQAELRAGAVGVV